MNTGKNSVLAERRPLRLCVNERCGYDAARHYSLRFKGPAEKRHPDDHVPAGKTRIEETQKIG